MSTVSQHHPLHEDLLAFISTTVMVSLGVYLLSQAGLITGGIAGLSLLVSELTGLSFGLLFTVLNAPFYILAVIELGWRFTINTICCVGMVSIFAEQLFRVLEINYLNPAFAAVAGGMLIGFGMLIVFRHQASLGGVGIMAYYLQNRLGWRAGVVQMVVDAGIFAVGLFVLPWPQLLVSLLGAFTLNSVLAVNHRPGRYRVA